MTTAVVPLDPAEAELWSGRPRLATVLPELVVGLVLVAIPIAVGTALDEPRLALLAPIGLALPARKYLAVTHTAFLVTDRACYRKTGILSRHVRRIGLDRVQNSAYRQGLRGLLLGHGTVVLEAAGGGRIRFHDVMAPREVRSLVDRRAGTDDVPGSVARWEAVLDEVRALRTTLVDG